MPRWLIKWASTNQEISGKDAAILKYQSQDPESSNGYLSLDNLLPQGKADNHHKDVPTAEDTSNKIPKDCPELLHTPGHSGPGHFTDLSTAHTVFYWIRFLVPI
jgi:hypothetical protein